jgi:outer membrane protein assembly factor BamB
VKRSTALTSAIPLAVAIFIAVGVTLLAGQSRSESQIVPQYHLSPDRAGRYTIAGMTWQRARFIHLDRGFDGRVDGHIYAQPLLAEVAGRELLIVATESNMVEALDVGTGKTMWRKSLGPAVTSSMLPCGNIDPLGITGTPAIDNRRHAVYLDAMLATGSGPQHYIFGLSLEKGQLEPGFPINVAQALASLGLKFLPRYQNQRGALLIMRNRVYIPYGGHFGDCGDYHGWVVGISLDGDHRSVAWRTTAEGGGIWAPGGVVSDGDFLFVATGNTFDASQWGGGEAVVRLSFDLKPPRSIRDYFAPSNWKRLDRSDADLGGTAPLPINLKGAAGVDRLMVALGKDGVAYLLNRDNLGGIGGELAAKEVSASRIISAPAVFPAPDNEELIVFPAEAFSCPAAGPGSSIGALEVRSTPKPEIAVRWCSPLEGRGTPIVTTTDGRSNPIVWIVGAEGDNRLHAFEGDNGKPIITVETPLQGLRHFAPILATKERLFVPADNRVYAFTF